MVSRTGFGLIEAIVAMTLLSIGVLALAATAGLAARITRESEAAERAAFHAGQVLDSLAAQSDPRDGSNTIGPFQITWTVQRRSGPVATIWLAVRFSDGTRVLTKTYSGSTVLP